MSEHTIKHLETNITFTITMEDSLKNDYKYQGMHLDDLRLLNSKINAIEILLNGFNYSIAMAINHSLALDDNMYGPALDALKLIESIGCKLSIIPDQTIKPSTSDIKIRKGDMIIDWKMGGRSRIIENISELKVHLSDGGTINRDRINTIYKIK